MRVLRFVRILAIETKYEFLKFVRLPAFVIPTVLFPLMFYTIFGLAFGGGGRPGSESVTTYLLATMGAFGVIGTSMFGLGVSVASDRGQGWLTVKRASPMPLAGYFGAKILMAMAFSAVIVALLFVLGFAFGHVHLPPSQCIVLAASLVFGAVPFCALGLAVGYLAGPNSAQAVVNMLYLPMSFASGLWMPLEILPRFVKQIAPALPPFHLARLALGSVALDASAASVHVLALLGFTTLVLGLAALGYARDEGRTYG